MEDGSNALVQDLEDKNRILVELMEHEQQISTALREELDAANKDRREIRRQLGSMRGGGSGNPWFI